jgi:tRNA (cmo5U34)-methyltransferase
MIIPHYGKFAKVRNAAGITLKKGDVQKMNKSTVAQIRERFDRDVGRFSNLETGQSSTIDAPLSLALIAGAASRITPEASSLLDIGCGAGNYSLKILEQLPDLDVTLIDLSRPMLERAVERVGRATSGKVTALQGDIRELNIGDSQFDVICAAAVLHHLREETEWQSVFRKLYASLKTGGSLWISDLVEHSDARLQSLMWERYGAYLSQLKDEAYRDQVFAYVAQEDSPRPLMFQLDLLRSVGFSHIEILHKNNCFAAFGAIKL